MLQQVFLHLLNMGGTASFVIVVVLAARLVLKKAPRIFSYLLWSTVLFRLVCPIRLESKLGIVPGRALIQLTGSAIHQEYQLVSGIFPIDSLMNQPVNLISKPGIAENLGIQFIPMDLIVRLGAYLWLIGAAMMLLYSIFSLLKLRRRLIGAIRLRDNIWIADHIGSAFVLGLLRPKIYLPSDLSVQEQSYILLHEQTHIRRLDHLMKPLTFLILTIYWFHPLVWVAFFLCGKDMEMSCDEAVIRQMGEEVRADYSASLLRLTTGKRMLSGVPLAFGEGNPKSRIKHLLHYKKPAFWVACTVFPAVAALCVCLAVNAAQKGNAFALTFTAISEGNHAEMQSFSLLMELPDGWTVQQPSGGLTYIGLMQDSPFAELPPGDFYSPCLIYDGDTLIGYAGCNTFTPYEDEIPQEQYYKTVYPTLRLSSMFGWDPYTAVQATENGETGIAQIWYLDPQEIDRHPGAMPEVPVLETLGILSYDRERAVFIGIAFLPNTVDQMQAEQIAQSVRIADAP